MEFVDRMGRLREELAISLGIGKPMLSDREREEPGAVARRTTGRRCDNHDDNNNASLARTRQRTMSRLARTKNLQVPGWGGGRCTTWWDCCCRLRMKTADDGYSPDMPNVVDVNRDDEDHGQRRGVDDPQHHTGSEDAGPFDSVTLHGHIRLRG